MNAYLLPHTPHELERIVEVLEDDVDDRLALARGNDGARRKLGHVAGVVGRNYLEAVASNELKKGTFRE